jgi:hypothetical protein
VGLHWGFGNCGVDKESGKGKRVIFTFLKYGSAKMVRESFEL